MGKQKRTLEIDREVLERVTNLAARGLTMDEIALSLGISRTSFYNKKSKNAEFKEAVDVGRAKGIAEVSNALFKKAVNGDNVAAIFYLKARAGWAETQKIDHSSTDGSMTPVQIIRKIVKNNT